MEKICEKERISTKKIITKVAEGKIVIPKILTETQKHVE